MKAAVVMMILSVMVSATLAAYTLCENSRNRSRCVAAYEGSTCPACPAGRVPLACSSLANGFEGYQYCADVKKKKRLDPDQCIDVLHEICSLENIEDVRNACMSVNPFGPDWEPQVVCDGIMFYDYQNSSHISRIRTAILRCTTTIPSNCSCCLFTCLNSNI
jgi:hypothetical protein